MDALSQLISLGQIKLRPDARCLLQGAFAMHHEPAGPGQTSFHLLLSGQCTLRTQGHAPTLMRAGDFVLLPHGHAHDLLDSGPDDSDRPRPTRDDRHKPLILLHNASPGQSTDVDLLCGRFEYGRGAGELLVRNLPSLLHVPLASHIEPLTALISLLRAEATNNQPGALAIVHALGQALLALALRAYGQKSDVPANVLALVADPRIGASVQAVIKAPEQNWTIESLGDHAAMSRATYARHFQQRAGMTVGDFLLRVRMMHASALLVESQRGICAIAQAVGYQSEAAFGKAFRQVMGATPGQWRRAH